uniref:Uncharacterized protein n=1 Tax=Loxodonta africana TaxID=9785 RepID=G3TYL9_LOXAF
WTLARKPKCYLFYPVTFLLLITLALTFFGYYLLLLRNQRFRANGVIKELNDLQVVKLSRMVYPPPDLISLFRENVLLILWLAPFVWEGTSNTHILNEQFWLQNATIGLTMFAVKKVCGLSEAAPRDRRGHVMVEHRVNCCVFADQPDVIPQVLLPEGRWMIIFEVWDYAGWQDSSMLHLEVINNFSEQHFLQEEDYLLCADGNLKFNDHVGVEILLVHHLACWLLQAQSQVYISEDEGDFYYTGFWGGGWCQVYRLTKACHQVTMVDQANDIEAVWHEESHLSKYLLYHKPTKSLSPEYVWNNQLLGWSTMMKRMRNVDPENHQAICN